MLAIICTLPYMMCFILIFHLFNEHWKYREENENMNGFEDEQAEVARQTLEYCIETQSIPQAERERYFIDIGSIYRECGGHVD